MGSNANDLATVPIMPSTNIGTHQKPLNTGLMNCQSIVNKYDDMVDIVSDVDFDALVITETWLTDKYSDTKIIGDMTLQGYTFHHAPRTRRKGGGVGILLRDSLKFKKHPCFKTNSFENYQFTFTSGGVTVRVTIVYRLHPTMKNCLKSSDFFRELSEFID